MDDALLHKISRQLRWLNIWITFFGVLILAGFAIAGVVLFKTLTYVHNEASKVDNFQQQTKQSLNLQKACNNSTVKSLLGSNSNLCN